MSVKRSVTVNPVSLVYVSQMPSYNFFASLTGCPQQIGPSLGRARLCEFSGQHYCESCHHGDATIIPSRMVHNWDLTQREVGTTCVDE